jgi:predicted amidohydrolase YtcJ
MSRDLLLHGVAVRTLDRAAPLGRELAIRDGRVAAGSAPGAERVDLAGCCVVPA